MSQVLTALVVFSKNLISIIKTHFPSEKTGEADIDFFFFFLTENGNSLVLRGLEIDRVFFFYQSIPIFGHCTDQPTVI